MTRTYDARKRREAAEKTREDIIQAAMKLHWEGITGFGPMALEAGCSLPTLRKHFPTKEALFRDCTRKFGETMAMPDLVALGAITAPEQRFEESVSELCRIHEEMFGYAWHSEYLRRGSPVLDEVMNAYDGLADAITAIITPASSTRAAVVRGLLDFLTYRALRLSGQLPPAQTREAMIATLRPLILHDQ